MFCPQCATPQADNAKFCRSCGISLEAVALALSGDAPAVRETRLTDSVHHWLKKETRAVSGIIRGGILFAVPAMIAVPMAVFLPPKVPWMVLWSVFFGWMAVWGGIDMAFNLAGLVEARTRMRLLHRGKSGPATSPYPDPRPVLNAVVAESDTAPMSVTEGTTRHLDNTVGR